MQKGQTMYGKKSSKKSSKKSVGNRPVPSKGGNKSEADMKKGAKGNRC